MANPVTDNVMYSNPSYTAPRIPLHLSERPKWRRRRRRPIHFTAASQAGFPFEKTQRDPCSGSDVVYYSRIHKYYTTCLYVRLLLTIQMDRGKMYMYSTCIGRNCRLLGRLFCIFVARKNFRGALPLWNRLGTGQACVRTTAAA